MFGTIGLLIRPRYPTTRPSFRTALITRTLPHVSTTTTTANIISFTYLECKSCDDQDRHERRACTTSARTPRCQASALGRPAQAAKSSSVPTSSAKMAPSASRPPRSRATASICVCIQPLCASTSHSYRADNHTDQAFIILHSPSLSVLNPRAHFRLTRRAAPPCDSAQSYMATT